MESFPTRPHLLYLSGELGSGKTTFLQGLAHGLGIAERLVSPTFILVRSYDAPIGIRFHHGDLYRLAKGSDLAALSLNEILADPDSLLALEWPERLDHKPAVPAIQIDCQSDQNSHQIRIKLVS
jgi:tRNA threonylcarbamoyladenosine biosynthesis protein TsaE